MDISNNYKLEKYSFMISVDRYINRYNYSTKAFEYFGLSKPELFKGFDYSTNEYSFLTKPPIVNITDLYKQYPHQIALLMSHLSCVLIARQYNFPYVVIFEDDAYPRKDICEKLKYYLSIIPDDCGILQLGFINTDYPTFANKYDMNFSIVTRHIIGYGAHAYIVMKDAYDEYIRAALLHYTPDGCLSSKHLLNHKVYVTNENLFLQVLKSDEPHAYNLKKYKNILCHMDNSKLFENGTFEIID